MRNRIGRADCERAIEHTAHEGHAARPPGDVVLGKAAPDGVVARVLGRHCRDHDDGDDTADDDEEHAQRLGVWHDAVRKHDDKDAEPGDEDIRDVHLPCVVDIGVLMVHDVEVHGDVGGDLQEGGEIEHPSVEVDPAGEETEHAAPFRACSDSRPVVYTTGCRDRGGELEECMSRIPFSL